MEEFCNFYFIFLFSKCVKITLIHTLLLLFCLQFIKVCHILKCLEFKYLSFFVSVYRFVLYVPGETKLPKSTHQDETYLHWWFLWSQSTLSIKIIT